MAPQVGEYNSIRVDTEEGCFGTNATTFQVAGICLVHSRALPQYLLPSKE